MKFLVPFFLIFSVSHLFSADWPQWRGPNKDNLALKEAKPVLEWSTEKNVRWKTPIPGRGHSTPIVVDQTIYLTTSDAEKETQSLIAVDRSNGKIKWTKVIHEGGFPAALHNENSAASQTAQWDGKHVLVTFENEAKIKVTAVKPSGEISWSKAVGAYKPSYKFGYGSTPVLYQSSLIVSIGTEVGGTLVSIKTSDGSENWRTPRAGHDYWATPVVAKVAGKEQLLLSGTGRFSSYDPKSGKEFWSAPLLPKSTCGTIVWTNDMVFASGGFPKNQTAGVKADGSGEVVWSNRERCYEQSLLAHKGHIYAITDSGKAICWDAKTGEEKWDERIGRGGVMASPLGVGDLIFMTMKDGSTTIIEASPEKFTVRAKNQLGNDTYASPVVVGDELFLRPGFVDRGTRQEFLYCLGLAK